MEVILLENIGNLGKIGEKVKVKSGYGRNFLMPYGKALAATEDNLKEFEARRVELEKKAAEILAQVKKRAKALEAFELTLPAEASEEGKLYGSIGTREIAEAITKAGHEIEKKEVLLPEGAIRQIGEYDIALQLHSEVTITIKVNVVTE